MKSMLSLTDKQISSVDMESRRELQLGSGDTVRVYQKIVEKGKQRLQVFEGVVIACKHGTEAGASFTVRRVGSDGVTVEKIFPLYSPMIDRIEVVRRTRMRRAKLYFLRSKTSKQTREKLRRTKMVSESTVSESQKAKEQLETVEPAVENVMDKEVPEATAEAETPAEEVAPAEETPVAPETPADDTSDAEEKKEEA